MPLSLIISAYMGTKISYDYFSYQTVITATMNSPEDVDFPGITIGLPIPIPFSKFKEKQPGYQMMDYLKKVLQTLPGRNVFNMTVGEKVVKCFVNFKT